MQKQEIPRGTSRYPALAWSSTHNYVASTYQSTLLITDLMGSNQGSGKRSLLLEYI